MDATVICLPTHEILDWPTFHKVFQSTLGFPAFYGNNMDAWIDCMTYIDSSAECMTKINVLPGQYLILRIDDANSFRRRCPEQFQALIDCSSFVNRRRTESGDLPVIGLLFV
jgi:RNAse (barnase) inhibitor barstar